ncbi:hypothetical protein [Paludibacterium sp.]|nr:hypothetical protein [Paludibacterium sp.]
MHSLPEEGTALPLAGPVNIDAASPTLADPYNGVRKNAQYLSR